MVSGQSTKAGCADEGGRDPVNRRARQHAALRIDDDRQYPIDEGTIADARQRHSDVTLTLAQSRL